MNSEPQIYVRQYLLLKNSGNKPIIMSIYASTLVCSQKDTDTVDASKMN